LSEIEIFERIVEDHAESGARKFLDIARGEAGDGFDDVERQAGVIPPIGANTGGTEVHGYWALRRYFLPSTSRSGSSCSAPKPKCRWRDHPSAWENLRVCLPSFFEKLSIVAR